MHAMFRSVLGFGLVSIPVEVYKALDDEKVALHFVHRPCHTRIRYQKYCPLCERSVEPEAIGRAAQLADGRLIMIDQDASKTPDKSERHISISGFHALAEIDPILYRAAYWLKPAAGGAKAYRLLLETMARQQLVAVATVTLSSAPSLAVVRSMADSVLLLHLLYYPESVRREGLEFGRLSVETSPQEKSLAEALVQHMRSAFDPRSYPNQQKRALLQKIDALSKEQTVTQPESIPPGLRDLMEKLKSSLESKDASTAF